MFENEHLNELLHVKESEALYFVSPTTFRGRPLVEVLGIEYAGENQYKEPVYRLVKAWGERPSGVKSWDEFARESVRLVKAQRGRIVGPKDSGAMSVMTGWTGGRPDKYAPGTYHGMFDDPVKSLIYDFGVGFQFTRIETLDEYPAVK